MTDEHTFDTDSRVPKPPSQPASVLADAFDRLLGARRGAGGSPASAPAASLSVRLREFASDLVGTGLHLDQARGIGAGYELRVVPGWAVGTRQQAPAFLVYDERLSAGRPPDAALLTCLVEDDGADEVQVDLVDAVFIFTFAELVSRP